MRARLFCYMQNEEGLTLKQERFVKEIVKDGNGARAAREAGYSKKSAKQIASENFTKPYIRRSIQEELDRIGITDAFLAKYLKKKLTAKKLQDCDVFIKNENGKYKINKNSNDFIEVDDNTNQLRACENILKLKKHLNNSESTISSEITINVWDKAIQILERWNDDRRPNGDEISRET